MEYIGIETMPKLVTKLDVFPNALVRGMLGEKPLPLHSQPVARKA